MKNSNLKKLNRLEQKNIKGSGIKKCGDNSDCGHTNAVPMLYVHTFLLQNANQYKNIGI
ncbi:hypothetical protein [Chryseobacterium culicis]|uniref:hypothetical protein n=1 Tax=Chryseobacterium culicis TaxID=680127 RepID=UPI001876389E|nr:hypothetical protein [Chryseobacterium culicis]MBE4949713.1 hypothetical protein [Chryseobacterium culicis]